ncbi:hypothetical protein KA005_76945, partial [bacterium]|nr:hypothetical protein [bacterium]
HMHRNICEDVRDIVIYGDEEIALCTDIELTADADPEEVMLQICLIVEEFLSPTLHFYTLKEMMEKGKTVEEIFEGRPMTVPDLQFATENNNDSKYLSFIPGHGFIDFDELKKLEPQSRIHVSDIHEKIMDIDGVLAIHKLVLVNYVNDLPQTKGEKWCLPLTKGYRPHMGIKSSKVNFLKGPLYFSYDQDEVIQRFTEEKFAKSKACLEPYQLDLPVPEGTYRDLQNYTSIQHEFPLTYGIGSEGIADPPTPLRKAKAHQLKAYLLFFDQILANYLSQLAHIRNLFSMRRDDDVARQDVDRTYFTQVLKDVPDIEDLIKNFNSCNTHCSRERLPEDYPSYLACITENPEDYQKRRNRFLDHLLARFSESFSDYVTLMYKLQKENRNEQDIIYSKASFLENYPDISRNRGKAFNMLEKPVWDTDNVAGLKKRITALLGIENANRQTLSQGEIVKEAEGWYYIVKDNEGQDLLKSKKVYDDKSSAEFAFESIQTQLEDQDQYYILNYQIPELKGYSYAIVDESGKAIVRSLEHFTNIEKLKECVDKVIALFNSNSEENPVNYIYPEEPNYYYYQVLDDANKAILESDRAFYREEDAIKSKALLEEMATYPMNYCRQNSVLKDAVQYGYVLLEATEKQQLLEIIAQSAERFDTREECEEVLYKFICLAKLKGIISTVK